MDAACPSPNRRTARSAALATAATLLVACSADVQLTSPSAPTAEPAVLTLVAADSALAERAGWSPGVPGATVFVRRNEDPTILTYTTDEQGLLSLPDLASADYWVWVEKHPEGAELEPSVLAPAALGGGARIGIPPGSRQTLALRSQDNGSLVISEFHYLWPGSAAVPGGYYKMDWYLELYNNADTTVYLDGKIVGAGFNYDIDAELWPCTETEEFRNEPRGIWSQLFQAFPGGGTDYPLAPGATAVVAEQAIDHSALYPALPDLSGADFQFYWASRALNPNVPAMLPIQLRTGVAETMFLPGFTVPFVAEPLDIASLERRQGRYTGGDEALFPREAILDVASLYSEAYLVPQSVTLCRMLVHPSLDALGAFVGPAESRENPPALSAVRRILPDGVHLQRTHVSASDWIMAPRSPGKVP
jgi:hypothetical protein